MADLVGTDIITSVRGLLEDSNYSQITILEASNWFVYQLYLQVKTRRMESSDELFPSQGDTEVEWPDDIQTLLSMAVTSPQVYDITDEMIAYDEFRRRYPGYKIYTQAQARRWTPFADGMRFASPLNADTVIAIDYCREPVPMVETTDTCEVKTIYGELVSKGTLARIMEINEDYEEAKEERKNLEPLMTLFTLREGRGLLKTGPVVIRTNRNHNGRRGSYSTDDFGR